MRKLVVVLLLAVAIGGGYYNALSNGFVFDDYLLVVEHAAIPRVASDPLLALSPPVVGYRPLRTLSYDLDYWIGGLQSCFFHLINLVYHLVTSCLVFFLSLRLIDGLAGTPDLITDDRSPIARFQLVDSHLRPALFATVLWA